ncbi:MAG: flagellar basal body rod protein FlgC [Nitrospirota bacterium]
MDIERALSISASALNSQRIRMNVIASNLANINSTRTEEGGPYRRRDVVFAAVTNNVAFQDILEKQINNVEVVKIVEDQRPFKMVYNPQHPDANEEGYVALPNINLIEEMTNMISASRSYEANVTAINVTKSMTKKALEIGR